MSIDPQLPSSILPKTKKPNNNKEQPSAISINDLTKRIEQSYTRLQNKYSESSSKNQTYLLTIYLKVLDKMLDQVVYAQERVRMLDNESLKEEKCVNYLHGIAYYRDQCYQTKAKLLEKQEVLKQEKKKTEDVQSEKDQLMNLCDKKDGELEILKIFVKRQKQLRKLSNNKIIEEVIQKEENLSQPRKQQKVFVVKNKKQKAQFRHTSQQKRAVLPQSKSSKGKKKAENQEALNSISADLEQQEKTQRQRTKSRHKKVPVIQHLPLDRMNETLWLYQPSSYRKTKYLNSNIHHKNIQLEAEQQSEKKLKISVISQDSTKKGSSMDRSRNVSQKSIERSKPKL